MIVPNYIPLLKSTKWLKLKQLVPIWCFCYLSLIGNAQPTFKEKVGSDVWGIGQVEYYFSGHSSLFFQGNVQRNSFAGDRLGNSPFDETNWTFGYEHFLREKWQIGFSQTRNRIVTGRNDLSHLYARHNGRLKSLLFLKRFGVEYIQAKDNRSKEKDFRFIGSLYIGKQFQWKNIPMQLGFRYTVARNWNDIGDPRRITNSQMWLDYQVSLTKNLIFGIYTMRDTNYLFAQEQFGEDADGNIVLIKPYRRLNLFTPVYGVRLRILLQPENNHPESPFNVGKQVVYKKAKK